MLWVNSRISLLHGAACVRPYGAHHAQQKVLCAMHRLGDGMRDITSVQSGRPV